jgi:hypothetical protein
MARELTEPVAQHAAARGRIIQVEFVDPPHQGKDGRRNRPRLVVEAAAAEVQKFSLSADSEIVLSVNHRFALRRPALLGAPDKKSFSSANSPILA